MFVLFFCCFFYSDSRTFCHSQQVDQSQQAHSSEVSLGVIALETNVSPLFGNSWLQFDVWHQQAPELRKQWQSYTIHVHNVWNCHINNLLP